MTLDHRRLALARLRLVEQRPYYASALFRLTPVSAPGLGTAAVDRHWRLYLDPDTAATWTVAQFAAVLEHELGHLLRDHAGRADQARVEHTGSSARFNIAADAEINDDFPHDAQGLPGQPVTPSALGLPDGQLAEWYFQHLPTDLDNEPDCGSGAHGQPRPWESPSPDENTVDAVTADVIRRAVAHDVRRHQQRSPGTVPAGLALWAQNLGRAQIHWSQVLRRAIRRHCAYTTGQVDYSNARPSRRSHVAHPVLLPSLRRPTPQVAVVLDTSGSMTQRHLDMAITEVAAILVHTGVHHVWLVSCDTVAQAALVRAGDLSHVQLTGGGGTALDAGLVMAVGLRPRPQLVVTLTDGETPWPTTAPGSVTHVVCVLGDGPDAPEWATTVRIPMLENAVDIHDIF